MIQLTISGGSCEAAKAAALARAQEEGWTRRIWAHDHTVWKPDPDEIRNRLGWLDAPFRYRERVPELMAFAEDVRRDGLDAVALLGMGGSSLAPDAFQRMFGGDAEEGLPLHVVDTTDADHIAAVERTLDLETTLFVVATKSGTTVETLSAFRYFHARVAEVVDDPGSHFVAITDPGSPLVELADDHDYRAVFLNDPEIGGRYSALSLFGLVPAALIGIDLDRLLSTAEAEACASGRPRCAGPADVSRALEMGATLGALAREGRDKLTLHASRELAPFCDWIEQLVAESTGKEGTGILPVTGERLGTPDDYGQDRVFVDLALDSDGSRTGALDALAEAGHPVVWLQVTDRHEVGALVFLWELATAVACAVLDVNPFDQPNVEAAKDAARELVGRFRETGEIQRSEPTEPDGEAVLRFLEGARPGAYVAIHAYVPPGDAVDGAFGHLRHAIREATGLATTLGYGPRFLHSTGQLHKGDGGSGRFIQVVSHAAAHLPIPADEGDGEPALDFDTLKWAQAEGDRRALEEAGREVVRFETGPDVVKTVRSLVPAGRP